MKLTLKPLTAAAQLPGVAFAQTTNAPAMPPTDATTRYAMSEEPQRHLASAMETCANMETYANKDNG